MSPLFYTVVIHCMFRNGERNMSISDDPSKTMCDNMDVNQ